MQAYHFFRPLLSPAHAWTAFRWQVFPGPAGDLPAMSAIAAACAPLTQLHPLFLPCQPAWLGEGAFQHLLRTLGPGRTTACLPAEAATHPETLAACRQLLAAGNHVGIDLAAGHPLPELSPADVDHLLIDVDHARNAIPLIDLINAYQNGFHLVATGVRTHEQFDWACAKRFTLASGESVTENDPRTPVDADTTRLKLLKLLSLVVQDADTRQIEEIFRQEPKLSYNLLRLVNSVAVGPKTPITGFNQAITVLGRRQLQRWLQLLIYANQFTQGNLPNPLLQLAAARGRQMELLISTLPADPDLADPGEAAFMVGIFSLLDTLLHMPMSEILASLPVAPTIAAALGRHEGPLGHLLEAIVKADAGELDTAAGLLESLGIGARDHVEAQVSAYSWSCRINLE